MRFVVIARASALIGFAGLLSACPKKDTDVVPEPAATTTAAQPPTGANDKAGAEAPATAAPATTAPAAAAPAAATATAAAAPAAKPKRKRNDDQGGW